MDTPKTRQEKYKRREKYTTLGSQKHIRARAALMEKVSNSNSSSVSKGEKKKK